MGNPQLSLTLTLSYRTGFLPSNTGTLCVEFSWADTIQQSCIDYFGDTAPVTQAGVNYEHLVLTTLLHTPIIVSINHIFWVVSLFEVNTNKPLVTFIPYEDLAWAFTCSQVILGIGTDGEGSVCRSLVLLTPNMESSRTPPIILLTLPGMVHHVDKHNLSLWTCDVFMLSKVSIVTEPCIMAIMGNPQLSLTLTLSYRTGIRSLITPTLSVKFSRAYVVQNCCVGYLWHTIPVTMDRVNYQHLIFLTLILTTIITSIDDIFRIVAARVIKVNAVESLTAIICNKDLSRTFTCPKVVLGIRAEDEWFVCWLSASSSAGRHSCCSCCCSC